MQDLQVELNNLRKNLNEAIKTIRQRGKIKAIAERDYRIALAKEILLLRDSGVPVTIISDICRGNVEVADLKVKRDIADSFYESNMQYIYSCKLNIDIVMKQIEAERKGE